MKKKVKKFHLVHYVEDCSAKVKTFKKRKQLYAFIDKFHKKYPNLESGDSWIECIVTGITGHIVNLDPSLKVELSHEKDI